MNSNTFKSDRKFFLCDYVSSHGQLLIRSLKSINHPNNLEHPNNIDIIFYGTDYVQLFIGGLDGISIRVVEKGIHFKYKKVQEVLGYKHTKVYEIISGAEIYYIVAFFVKIYENKLDIGE